MSPGLHLGAPPEPFLESNQLFKASSLAAFSPASGRPLGGRVFPLLNQMIAVFGSLLVNLYSLKAIHDILSNKTNDSCNLFFVFENELWKTSAVETGVKCHIT